MNVREYFETILSARHLVGMTADEIEALESMPVDSVCGEDCKNALNSCATLLISIHRAFGPDSNEEDEIVAATLSAVICFICG